MKITLLTSSTTVGKKGETVDVGMNLAIGLVGRGQAVYGGSKPNRSTDYTAKEAVEKIKDMAPHEAAQFAKGDDRKTVLKELKEASSTKELKEEYDTKDV
jgi:hypothetical protein